MDIEMVMWIHWLSTFQILIPTTFVILAGRRGTAIDPAALSPAATAQAHRKSHQKRPLMEELPPLMAFHFVIVSAVIAR